MYDNQVEHLKNTRYKVQLSILFIPLIILQKYGKLELTKDFRESKSIFAHSKS